MFWWGCPLIDKEWVIIGVLTLSPALWMIGGKVNKAIRRILLPLILAVAASILSGSILRGVGVGILTFGAASLGYGENTPVFMRVLTALAFGLCLAPLIQGANAMMMLLPPVAFGLSYWLSLRYNWFVWKASEAITGFSIGATLVLMAMWR